MSTTFFHKYFTSMLRYLILSYVCIFCFDAGHLYAGTLSIEIPGSFNPVGSGARAMGMGGAFIGIADDATASSWNPGALIHLKRPEYSLVVTHERLMEKNRFGTHEEASGNEPASNMTINYLSAAYPFGFFNTNMILAASVQRLYSLDRRWNFTFNEQTPIESSNAQWSYEQTGDLYAVGLSWCIELIQPILAVGITINRWQDGLMGDQWQRNYHVDATGVYDGPYIEKIDQSESYDFSGWNVTLGVVWDINEQWRLGAVLKTPFNATINQKSRSDYFYQSTTKTIPPEPEQSYQTARLEMPLSYGLGFVYQWTENFYLAADIYETHWNHFLFRSQTGQETCPISGLPRSEFQMDRTYQVRIGGEYIFLDTIHRRFIPFRFGVFYDPMPSENHGDDVYGFSLGTGWTVMNQFSMDLAYQFRYGNQIGEHYLPHLDFSQNIRESKVYCSLIVYFSSIP
ncbi:MAG: outer membrane protein transport protein [Candidatus Magnetomorum sp.]|nr:outer membrane protein transport protein [Candidatus Magnetomorum sp.]